MNDSVSGLLRLSRCLYSRLLSFYPCEIRVRYETEMRELFCNQLDDAWFRMGLSGLAGVWWSVGRETCWIALPWCFRVSLIGVVSVLSSLLLFYALGLNTVPFYPDVTRPGERRVHFGMVESPWMKCPPKQRAFHQYWGNTAPIPKEGS